MLHLPLAVSSFSFVSRSSEKAIEMLQREISSNEPPSDPSQPQQIPSNTSGLLPMQIVDSTTLHVLPSIHYQRARAPTTSQHQRGTSTQGGSLSSSSSHNASTASLVNLQSRDTPVLGPTSAGLSVNPSPAGAPRNLRSNMTGLTMPSRKGSGAQPPLGFNSPAQFHSPHLASYSSGPLLSSSSFSQPGSSPKYGPALGFGNASPRFSFLPSMAYPSTSLYSTSVSASPLISATSNQRDRDAPMPNFSLGNSAATVTTMGSESAEVTMLPISEQLLLVSLDQGVLLMDLNHVWTLLLSFPPPPTGPASGLPPSASSASLASAAAGSNPSATPPSRGGSAITSPPRVSLAGSAVGIGGQPVPMMQRTASAPGIAQLEAASRDYLLSPPVPASSLSNSTSSTPSLRPAIGRRQPSGINLNALEQTAPVTVSGFVTPTAGSVTDLPSPSSLKVTLANVPSGSNDGGTPLLSPSGATTPQARSISNSRNASSASLAGMGGAAPVISPTASSFQGPKNVDSVRARVVRVGTEGGMAVLDALGRFTLQMVGKQLQVQEQAGSSSTTSPNTVAVSPQTPKPNWYEYSFHLPGQFMQMLTVPMRGDLREGDVEQTVLLACSWDGSVYFIPILPCICPPMPAADESSASSRATNDYPLILTRFQHPTRIQSFHSALFSIVPSQPAVPCLFFLTFQNELLIYPDAFDAAGLDQWKAEWTWRERQGKMSRSPSEGEISGAQAGAEGTPPVASAGIAIVEPEVASSYELTIRSSKRTVLEAWRESDARLAAALLEAPDSPADQGDMAMAALPTLARVSSSNSTPAAIIATEQSVAPYLRELRSADLAILNAYRDHLKAQLGIPTEPEVAVQTSSVSPPGVVSQILPQSPRDFVGAASPPIVATPTSSPTHRVQGSTGSLTFGASPLFASFKVATTNHFKSPSGEFQRAMEPNAQPVGSWKLEDRMKTVEEQAPSPMSSFWRKLLRRST